MRNINTVILSLLLIMTIGTAYGQDQTTPAQTYDESILGPITLYTWSNQACSGCEILSIGNGSLGDVVTNPIDHNNRIIPKRTLTYMLKRQIVRYKVNEMTGLTVEDALDSSFNKVMSGGYYAKVLAINNEFVAVNGHTNKLAQLIFDQGESVKSLSIGESWNMAGGYMLNVISADARSVPRQVWLKLYRGDTLLDDKVVSQGGVYTYVQRSMGNEADVPVFVTYIDNVQENGAMTTVQLKYTWVISNDTTTINVGDIAGRLKVKSVTDDQIVFWNDNESINLIPNSTIDILGNNLKFVVYDDINNLKFYPIAINGANRPQPPEEGSWIQNPNNGHYYKLTIPMLWEYAEARAVELGGHLVTINGRQEELWLRSQFGTNELFWLGFNDIGNEGNWKWSSGEPITYTNWRPGEPNNRAGNGMPENSAVMNWGYYENDTVHYDDGWNDVLDGAYRGIIETSSIIVPTPVPTPSATIFVSALAEGTRGNANADGTYRFTIISGASERSPQRSQPYHPETWGWDTQVLIYKNRQVDWSGGVTPLAPGHTMPANWDFSVGSHNLRPTYMQAESDGRGMFVDIPLLVNDYVTMVVNDCQGCFGDNSGGVNISVDVLSALTPTPTSTPPVSSGTVNRSRSPTVVAPNGIVTITLMPSPSSMFDSPGYRVIETIPPEFTYIGTNAGEEINGNIITLVQVGSSPITYTLRAPSMKGAYNVTGTFSDELANVGNVGGARKIKVGISYDTNNNGKIDRSEAIQAVADYFNGVITRQNAIDVVMTYFAGTV